MSQQLNLVNAALLPPKPFFQFASMMLSLGVMLVVLVAFAVLVFSQLATYEGAAVQSAQRVTAKQAQIAALEQATGQRVASPRLLEEQSAVMAEGQRLQQLAGQLGQLGGQEALRSRAEMLFALAARPANGVWLTAIDVSGERIALDGKTLSAERLPPWLEQIRQTPAFAGQRFGGFNLGASESAGEATAYAFRLEAVRARGEARAAP